MRDNPIDLGTGTLYVNSTTTLSVDGNSFNTVTIDWGGNLKLGVADALPTGVAVKLGSSGSGGKGTLDLNGFDQTIGQLTDGGTAYTNELVTNTNSTTAATLTVNQSATTTYQGTIAGNLALTKSGTGTLTLGGPDSNTFTGLTTVSGGTLLLDKDAGEIAIAGDILVDGGTLEPLASNQIADTSSITVNAGRLYYHSSDQVTNVTVNCATSAGYHLINGLDITGTLSISAGDTVVGSGSSSTAASVDMTGGKTCPGGQRCQLDLQHRCGRARNVRRYASVRLRRGHPYSLGQPRRRLHGKRHQQHQFPQYRRATFARSPGRDPHVRHH